MSKSLNLIDINNYAVQKMKSESGGDTPVVRGQYNVKVIDYDGTVLKEEWLNAGDEFEFPTPPTHKGLVFDGWACTEDIVDNKITVIDQDVIAGANYYTESGALEVDIELTKFTGLTVNINPATGAYGYYYSTADWGDGTSDTSSVRTHTYNKYGKYTIKIFGNVNGSAPILSNYNNQNYYVVAIKFPKVNNGYLMTGNTQYFSYFNNLKYVIFPSNMRINDSRLNMFSGYQSLKALVLPQQLNRLCKLGSTNIWDINNKVVIPYGQTKLENMGGTNPTKKLILPRTITNIDVGFSGWGKLKEFVPRNTVTQITLNQNSFMYCYVLEKVVFSCNIDSIPASCFANCPNLKLLDFRNNTQVPTLANSTNCITSTEVKIIVPDDLYEDWIVATNWTAYADCIVKASEDVA